MLYSVEENTRYDMLFIDKILDYYQVAKTEMFSILGDFWQSWVIRIYFILFILLNSLSWYFADYIRRTIGQSEMALHYSVDFGIDLYGPVSKIYTLPLLGLVFFFINSTLLIILSIMAKKESVILSHLLLASSVFANLLLLTALVSIYLVNFR